MPQGLDGDGHIISVVYINSANNNYQGLFGYVGTGNTYKYCILDKGRACLSGSYEVCQTNGRLSNTCPYSNITTQK